MNTAGPIVIIEDDSDDAQFIKEAFLQLNIPNEILFLEDSEKALDYLINSTIEPFIVFSDINMPKLNGMELRQKIHENENVRLKTTPYLFFSTSSEQSHVIEAYSRSIQGFFIKPADFDDLRNLLKMIVDYWSHCVSPKYTP